MMRDLWSHRRLIWTLARREIQGKYRGSLFGTAWSAITPLLMLAIYTFVFSVVFQSRWGQEGDKLDFALILFLGMLCFNIFAEVVVRAPGLIIGNVNYVKKVVFPLQILPCVALVTSLFHAAISFLVWLAAMVLIGRGVPATAVFLPLYLLPLVLATLGFAWFLAALGVYLRDIGQVISVLVTGLLFLSPIFFSARSVPEEFRPLIVWNPLSHVLEGLRAVAVFGEMPQWAALSLLMLGALPIAWAGHAFFQATRRGFADVV
jgi:lipopolysaccharide transport system permease protein